VEIEESLPQEPKVTAVAEGGSKRSDATSDEENVKNAQASLKALEMLRTGSLSEKSALAVIGTDQDAYSVAPDVRIKALELVEEGKLSERGLIAILGV
jgi:DNA-binding ferritin-like protein (Dps family)